MIAANLPYYLRANARENSLIVEFDDGDRYPVVALDLLREDSDDDFEIHVAFTDCLGDSAAYARARDAGSPEGFPNSWWSSDTPRKPVGMRYTLSQVRSVFDRDLGRRVYEKETPAQST